MLLFCFFRWWSSLELYTISECLRFIFCFLTVAVQCREWKWKAAIFIQCLCEPDTVDWLNACHIDTPVVSPMCPQRHNGIGSAAPFCVYMPLAANSVTCWLYNVDDFFFVILSNEILDLREISSGRWLCSAVGFFFITQFASQRHYLSALYVVFFVLDGRIELWFPHYCTACPASNGFYSGEYHPYLFL